MKKKASKDNVLLQTNRISRYKPSWLACSLPVPVFRRLYSSQKASIQFNIAPKTTFAGSCFECGWLFQVLVTAKVKVLKELDRNRIGMKVRWLGKEVRETSV
jgi:hypothetical protein